MKRFSSSMWKTLENVYTYIIHVLIHHFLTQYYWQNYFSGKLFLLNFSVFASCGPPAAFLPQEECTVTIFRGSIIQPPIISLQKLQLQCNPLHRPVQNTVHSNVLQIPDGNLQDNRFLIYLSSFFPFGRWLKLLISTNCLHTVGLTMISVPIVLMEQKPCNFFLMERI